LVSHAENIANVPYSDIRTENGREILFLEGKLIVERLIALLLILVKEIP
jgi:hypothetical protein